jgi:hypothetical protein
MATRRHHYARKWTTPMPLAPHTKKRCMTNTGTPTPKPIYGVGLRFLIVDELRSSRQPVTVGQLAERLQHQGFTFNTRPSKAISDSLRTELRKGRVRRTARGVYLYITATRSTLRRIRTMAHHCREYVVAQTRPQQPPWKNHHWIWRI